MKYNMKKSVSLFLAVLVLLTTVTVQPFSVQSAETPDINAKSAILVDAETGKVIYAKNPDMALPPASMTKMMTEYLVQEAIEKDDISWDTKTKISDYAYSISANATFSGIGLRQDKKYTVEELYNAMAVFSDNGTTIALAELIAGSEGDFVKMMNDKAKEMGLPEYEFVNSTGLANSSLGENAPEGTDSNGNNRLSARSAALLAYNLVNDYPQALEVTSQTKTEFEGYTVENLNWMLEHDSVNLEQFYYEGIDGLKTGFTDMAGYCFTGTAKKDNKRYISVVMKTDSKGARFKETAKLLDYGFKKFENQEIFPAGYQLEGKSDIPVSKGKEDSVQVATSQAFKAPVIGEQSENYSIKYKLDKDKLNKDGKLAAPIEKGEQVGTAQVVYNGKNDYGYIFPNADKQSIDLVAQKGVEKDNWFMLTLGAIGGFFGNIFNTVVDTVKGWFN
ncbi:D-alanyl-D-alanine carboxypeptidase DacA [Lentibacillus kapialis]|uniref:serine-type D-Ala-D-Ala carboxypeptidase n=1 Tax=Lentibacillus kapialis TaxID=340214 RepID=A0A917UW29_9BACI|nr:serine hydrolase [Lentibacillus kapialis]GGJ89482.1 D-alanyl-D-alanine carboxypeptidase DacA [Lentibacillus kapialis]